MQLVDNADVRQSSRYTISHVQCFILSAIAQSSNLIGGMA